MSNNFSDDDFVGHCTHQHSLSIQSATLAATCMWLQRVMAMHGFVVCGVDCADLGLATCVRLFDNAGMP